MDIENTMEEEKFIHLKALTEALEKAKTIKTATAEDSYKLGEIMGILFSVRAYIRHS